MEERFPRQLSGGQQQRVALARVLALRPKLLLFDEPLSNLDAKLRVQMRHEIRRLQKEVGITALFVTHDQEEAMTIADRIVVINKGRIEQAGPPAEIYDRPATRFVADFIGTANLITGNIRPDGFVSARGLRLSLPAGESSQPNEVALAIRPEKIEITPDPAPDALSGTISRTTRLGSIVEYDVSLPSGDSVIVQEQGRAGLQQYEPGLVVAVRWRPEDARILP
jgi:ABC-type Fe3+/spermidine/putrescine transport system ATPase subunit